MTLKQKIQQQHLQLVQDRIDAFKDMILGLTEDTKNDANLLRMYPKLPPNLA